MAARERWKILKEAIISAQRKKGERSSSSEKSGNNPVSAVSVKRFTSFGLFTVTSDLCEEGGQWVLYTYTQTSFENEESCPAVLVRVPARPPSLQDMIGFNNTGNVCIWPSEEVLAHYCLSHAHLFEGCSVCELGCGLSALAGILLASTNQPSRVVVTDGNESSVENVSVIVSANRGRFRGTAVSSQLLHWDNSFLQCPSPLDGTFDWLICADCLFFTELHQTLVWTMLKLLRPERGRVLMFAPGRSGSLDQFVCVAEKAFKIEREDRYDDTVHRKHEQLLKTESYQPDLHYPTLLHLHTLTPHTA